MCRNQKTQAGPHQADKLCLELLIPSAINASSALKHILMFARQGACQVRSLMFIDVERHSHIHTTVHLPRAVKNALPMLKGMFMYTMCCTCLPPDSTKSHSLIVVASDPPVSRYWNTDAPGHNLLRTEPSSVFVAVLAVAEASSRN